MQIVQVTVRLPEGEYQALLSLAAGDCRRPHDELRFLLQQEARRRGLLAADRNTDTNQARIEGQADDNPRE